VTRVDTPWDAVIMRLALERAAEMAEDRMMIAVGRALKGFFGKN